MSADESVIISKKEDGLIHTKQKGRYEVYKKLPDTAESLDSAFDYAKPFATFRLANVTTNQKGLPDFGISDEKKYGTAFGGILGLESAALYGVSLRLGTYVSQKVNWLNPNEALKQNRELFDANSESYIYMGEASLSYENSFVKLQAGRIRLETPYVNSDDIRMSPNSFEGLSTHLKLDEQLHAELYVLTRWAGVDSGDDVEQFKAFVNGGYGLSGAGLTYQFNDENEISLWYYNVDKESDIIYSEATGDVLIHKPFHIEWGLQGAYIMQCDGSEVEGVVVGGMTIIDFSALYFGLSYNYAFEKNSNTITDGFGGGPYYTSLDEQTLGAVSALAPGNDLGVYRVAVGTNIRVINRQNLNLEVVHGHFYLEESSAEAIETDLILNYTISERWHVESAYAHVDLKNIDYSITSNRELRDFQRLVTRLDYKF